MPVNRIFHFTRDWLDQGCNIDLNLESVILVLRPDCQLDNEGCVFSIPIVEDDVIDIQIELSHIQTPSGQRGMGMHHMDSGSRQSRPLNPVSPNKGGMLNDVGTGLASQSYYDRIRQNFKCPKFTGKPKDWKGWDKGLQRYLSIWELQHVLHPDFFSNPPLTQVQHRDNKLVYYIIEEAVQQSNLAASYVRKAPLNNGFEAYYTLMDGFVFAGATTASLLLNELTGFRFLQNETPTALVLRLGELFHDLEALPGQAAMTFNDTQRIGYLLNALRHEKEWHTVHSALTSRQINGDITFLQACTELTVRCEANRAAEMMDRPISQKAVKVGAAQIELVLPADATKEQVLTFISSHMKKHNITDLSGDNKHGRRSGKTRPSLPCLAKGCDDESPYPLCSLHYHSLVAGKSDTLELRNNYGSAKYDAATKLIIYPDKVPADRRPSNVQRVKVGAAKLEDNE
jgi:hypothetical protein